MNSSSFHSTGNYPDAPVDTPSDPSDLNNTLQGINKPDSPTDNPQLSESCPDLELDHTLLKERAAEVRNDLSNNATPSPEKPDRIDHATFLKRLQEMLASQTNTHLTVALGFLAGIVDSTDNIIDKINEKDGVQMIVQVLIGYIEEHYEEITEQLLPKHPNLQSDVNDFAESYKDKGSEKELTTLYLAQLTHFAFHMIYYGYTPADYAAMDYDPNEQSIIVLTRSSSIITVSKNSQGTTKGSYLRIAKRDNADSESPIDIYTSYPDYRFYAEIPGNISRSIGGYSNFSPNRILAIKGASMSRYEAADMSGATSQMTDTCTR